MLTGKHRKVKCQNCNGTGKVPILDKEGKPVKVPCGVCGGTGWL